MPLTYPITPVQVVQVKKPLKPFAPKAPIAPVPPIQPGGFRTTPNVGTNPREVNSFSDVLFNDQGRRWATKNFIESDDNLFTWLGDTVNVGVKYLREQYVEPVMDGNWAGFGTNALSAFGEDADLLSNFTKGMIIESGTQESSLVLGALASVAAVAATALSGGTFALAMSAGFLAGGVTAVGNAAITDPEGAMRGLARASGSTYEGKYNYNFNLHTGNGLTSWLGEMYGEIAVDPLNWLSFGAGMANDLVSEATEELGTQVGKQSNNFLKLFNRLGDLDDVVTKTAFLSNPIGLGLYGLYSGTKYATSATQRSFVKSFIEGALDAKVFNAKAASTAYSSIEAVTQKEITSLRKTYFKELRFLKKDSQTYYTWLTDVQRRLMSEMKMTAEQAEERSKDLLYKFFTEKDTSFLADYAKNKTQRKGYEKFISDLKLKTLGPDDMAAKGSKAMGEFGSAAYVAAGGFKRDVDALNAFVDTISGYSIKTNTFVLAMDERMTKVISEVQKSMNFEMFGRSKADYVYSVYQALQKEFPDFITLDFAKDRRFAAWVYGSLMADSGISFEEFFNIQKAMQKGKYVFDHPETALEAIQNQIKGVSTITSTPFNESIARLKDLEVLSPEQRELLQRLNADQYTKVRNTIESQVPKGYKPKKIMDHVISMIPKFFTAERKLDYVKRLTVDPNTQDLMDFVHTYGQIEDDGELLQMLTKASGIDDALVLENMRRIIRDVNTVEKYASDTSDKLAKSVKKRASDAKKAASTAGKKGLLARMAEMKSRPEDDFIQAYLNLSRSDFDSLRQLFVRQGYEGDAFLKNFEALNFIDPHPFFGIEEAATKVLKDSGAYILNINKAMMDQIMATEILESDLINAFSEIMDETQPLGKLFSLIVHSDLSHPDFEEVYHGAQRIYASLKSFQHYIEMSQNMRQIINMDVIIEPNRKLIMGMKVPAKLIQDSDGVIRLKTIRGTTVEMTMDDIYKNEEYSKAFINDEGMFTVFDMDGVNLVNSEDVLTEFEGAKRLSTTFAQELEEMRTQTIADRIVKVTEEAKKLEDIDVELARLHQQQSILQGRIESHKAGLATKIADLEAQMAETQRKIDSIGDDSQVHRDAIGKLEIEKANLTLKRNTLRDAETDASISVAKLQQQNNTWIREIKKAEVQKRQAVEVVQNRLNFLESKYDQLSKVYEWNKKQAENKLKNKVYAVAKAILRKEIKSEVVPDLTGVLDSIPAAMKAIGANGVHSTEFYSVYSGIKNIIAEVDESSKALDTYLGEAVFKNELVSRLNDPFPNTYRPSNELDSAVLTFEKDKSLKRQVPGAPKTYQQDIHNIIFKHGRTRPVFLGGYAPESVRKVVLQWPSVNAFVNFRKVIDGEYLSHIYMGKNNLDGMEYRVNALVDQISAAISTKELEVQNISNTTRPALTNELKLAKSALTDNITRINREISDLILSSSDVDAYRNATHLDMIEKVAVDLDHEMVNNLSARTAHGDRLHELIDLRKASFDEYSSKARRIGQEMDSAREASNTPVDLSQFKKEVELITHRFTKYEADEVWRYINSNIDKADSYELFKSDLVMYLNQKVARKGSSLSEQKAEALGKYGKMYIKTYLNVLGRKGQDAEAVETAMKTTLAIMDNDMRSVAPGRYRKIADNKTALMGGESIFSGAQLEADARLLAFDSMMKAGTQWNLVNMDTDSLKNYFGNNHQIYKQYYEAPREMMASIVDGRSPLWDMHNKEVLETRRTEFIDRVLAQEERLYAEVQPKIKEAELKYNELNAKVEHIRINQKVAGKVKGPTGEDALASDFEKFATNWKDRAVGERDARLFNNLVSHTSMNMDESMLLYRKLADDSKKLGADGALKEFEAALRSKLSSSFRQRQFSNKVTPSLSDADLKVIKDRDAALEVLEELRDKSTQHSRAQAIVRAQDMADSTLRDKGGVPHLVWDEATVKWYVAKYPQFKITDVARMLYQAMEEHPDWPVYIRNHVVPVAKQGTLSGLDEVGEFTKSNLVHQWLRRGVEFYYDVPQDSRKLLTYEDFITQLRDEFDNIKGLTRHNGVWGYGTTTYQPLFFGQTRDFTRKVTDINNIPTEAVDLLKSYTYSNTPEFRGMVEQISSIKKAGVNLDGAPFGLKLSKDTSGLATKTFEPIKGYPLQIVTDHTQLVYTPKQLLEPSDVVVIQKYRAELAQNIQEINTELEDFIKPRVDKMGNRTLPSLLDEARDADSQLTVGTRAIVATYGGGEVVDIKNSLIVDNMYKQAERGSTSGAQGSMKFDKAHTRTFDVVGEELRVAETELENMRQDFEVRKLDPKTNIPLFEENLTKKTAQVDMLRREMQQKYQQNLQDAQRWIKDKATIESGRTDVAIIRLDKPLQFKGKTVFTKEAVDETDKLRFAALSTDGEDVVKRVEDFYKTAVDIKNADGTVKTVAQQFEELDRFFIIPAKLDSMYAGNLGRITNITMDTSRVETSGLYQKMYKIDYELYHKAEDGTVAPFTDIMVRKSVDEKGPVHAASAYNIYERYTRLLKKRARFEELAQSDIEKRLLENKTTLKETMDRLHGRGSLVTGTSQNVYDRKAELGRLDTAPGDITTYTKEDDPKVYDIVPVEVLQILTPGGVTNFSHHNPEYSFMGNMHKLPPKWPVHYNGLEFHTVEAAYQAAKFKRIEDQIRVRDAGNQMKVNAEGVSYLSHGTGSDAKRVAYEIWDEYKAKPAVVQAEHMYSAEEFDAQKVNLMYGLLREKFRIPHMAKKLVETGGVPLVEGNYWGDDFWGVYTAEGQNQLGELLMRIRGELGGSGVVPWRVGQRMWQSSEPVKVVDGKVQSLVKEVPVEEAGVKTFKGHITTLKPNEVFVFGSNDKGRHGNRAAAQALKDFGAVEGQGSGLQGQSYGLMTRNYHGKGVPVTTRTLEEITVEVQKFVDFAKANPQTTFYLTNVGTGAAGIPIKKIAEMLKKSGVPSNVIISEDMAKEFRIKVVDGKVQNVTKEVDPAFGRLTEDEKLYELGVATLKEDPKYNVYASLEDPSKTSSDLGSCFIGPTGIQYNGEYHADIARILSPKVLTPEEISKYEKDWVSKYSPEDAVYDEDGLLVTPGRTAEDLRKEFRFGNDILGQRGYLMFADGLWIPSSVEPTALQYEVIRKNLNFLADGAKRVDDVAFSYRMIAQDYNLGTVKPPVLKNWDEAYTYIRKYFDTQKKVADVTKVEYPKLDKLRIISGGQSGGDLGGLIAAKRLGLPTGGTMPKGFKTEDGVHPEFAKEFGIVEDSSDDYVSRTKKNVDSSDATIAFLWDSEKSKGTLKTIGYAQSKVWRNGTPSTSWGGYKPVLVVTTKDPEEAAKQIKEFMASFKPRVLNIAGQRESHQKGIQRFVSDALFRGIAEPGQGAYMYKLPKAEEAVESAAEVIKRPVAEGLEEYMGISYKSKAPGTRFEEMQEYLNRVKEAETARLKQEQFSDAELVKFGLEMRKSNPTLAKWYDQLSRDLKIDFIHNPTIPEDVVLEQKGVQRVMEEMAATTSKMDATREEFNPLYEKLKVLSDRQTGVEDSIKDIDDRIGAIHEEEWGIRNQARGNAKALYDARNNIAGEMKEAKISPVDGRIVSENANMIGELKKLRYEQQKVLWGVEGELNASKTTSFAKKMRNAEMVKMFGPRYKEFEAYIDLVESGKITPEEFITIVKRVDGIIDEKGNTFLSRKFATQRVVDKIQNFGISGGKVSEPIFRDEPEVAEKLYQRALNILSEYRSLTPVETLEALTEESLRAKFAMITTEPRYAAAIDSLINEIYNYLGLQRKFENMGIQTIMFPDSSVKQLFDGLMGGQLEEFLGKINDPTLQKEMYIEKIRGFYSAFIERTNKEPAVLDQMVKGQADILDLQKMAHQYYFIAKKSVSNLIQTNEMVGALRLDSEGSPVAGIIQRFLNAGGRKLIEANPALQELWDASDVKGREALIKKYGIDVQVEDVLTDVYENMIAKRGVREMDTIDIGDMGHIELRTELGMAVQDGDGAEIARLHQELTMKEYAAAQRATQGLPGVGDALYNAQINNHAMLDATAAVQLKIAKTRTSFGGLAESTGYDLLAQRGGKLINDMLDFNKGDRSIFARLVRFHTPGGLLVMDRSLLNTLDGRTLLELEEQYGIRMIESMGKLPTDFNLVGFKSIRKVDGLESLGPLQNTLVKGYDDLKGIDFESRAIMDNFYNEFQNVATQTFPFHWSNMPLYRFKDTSLVPWLFDKGFIGEDEINAFSSALQDSGALNISVIGGRDLLKGVVDILPYSPLDMMVTSGYSLSRHSTAKPKFLRLFMQDEYKIASYLGTTDPKEAFRLYQGMSEELEVVILKKDLNLHRVAINSWKDMKFAMDNKAIVTNYPGFVEMYKSLDTWKMPALLDWMDRNLNSVFKSGIMTSFGLATRNFFDNNVKLLAMAKGDVDVFAFVPEAHKYIDRFTKMAMDLEGFQDGRKVLDYLRGASDEDRKIYFLMMQAKKAQIAGAPLDAIMDVTEATRLATSVRIGDIDEGSLIQNLAWGNPLTQLALSMQNWSEQRWRLAAYLYLVDGGKTTSEASKKVAEYFIDYSVKGKGLKVLNVLMPFSMFTIKNTLLWAKHAMDTPWLLRAMVDMGTSTWHNVEAEQKGYMSASQKRNYLSGNVSLGSTVVKANPSFFDAINTIPGVIQDPLGRFSPAIKDAVKLIQGDIDGLTLPWEGVADRARTVSEGVQDLAAGNGITPSQVVPSLFSDMTTYTNSFTSYQPQPRYRGINTMSYATKMGIRNTNRLVQSSMLYRKNYYNVVWRYRFKPKKAKPF